MADAKSSTPTTIRVALDWTPNTLHSGLFIAQARNLYASKGLTVQLTPPPSDYSTTPAKLVESGQADLCLCPSESCIAYAESRQEGKSEMELQAIYAICAQDASAIVAKKDGGKVERMRDLGDKGLVYGSYDARYEDFIVRAMVEADGCKNVEKMHISGAPNVGKLDLFSVMKKSDGVDATWVFLPWEGVEAEMEGIELQKFVPGEFGVPYGYSPVIARNAASTSISEDALQAFIEATKEGYSIALNDAKAAVQALKGQCVPEKSEEFLETSQKRINEFYGSKEDLGRMDDAKWEKWISWLIEKKLLKHEVDVGQLFTNKFFLS